MKIAKFVATAAIGSLLATPVMASDDGMESNYEIQNTYQHEYSENKVPDWAEQERVRHTERQRLQEHLAVDADDGFKLEVQNRYQHQERHQVGRGGGDFGRSGSAGFGGSGSSGQGAAGASSGSSKGSNGRY